MNSHHNFTRSIFCAVTALFLWEAAWAVDIPVSGQTTIEYLLSCQKENGAFGPRNQEYTDVAWNYPAVHALTLLGEEIPRAADALSNGDHMLHEYGGHGPSNYWGYYQKAMLNKLLGGDGPIEWGRSWSLNYSSRGGATKLGWSAGTYRDMGTMWYHVGAVLATNGTISNGNSIRDYCNRYQTGLGGYASGINNDPVMDKDANIMATHHAVMAITSVGLDVPNQADVINFLQSCQTESGGFRWHPTNPSSGNMPDVWYTWGAIRALQALGSEPADVPGCIAWLNSLQNADGGFGDQPGWLSRNYSTYYAVDALELLTGDAKSAITPKLVAFTPVTIPEGTYSIFVTHFKAPTGNTGGTIDKLLDWGYTSYFPREVHRGSDQPKGDNIPEARDHIQSNNLDALLVHSPEKYHFQFKVRGGGMTNHTSNWLRPTNITTEQRAVFDRSNDRGGDGLHWDDFKEEVLKPVFDIGTFYWPELEWSMLDAYMMNDDGMGGNVGWNAVVAGLGWPPWDWLRSYPFRERWIGQLPMIIDGDAHGDADEWKKALSRQRTLYLAEDNSWEGFLEAFQANRVVSVIYDHEGCCERVNPDGGVLTFYGPPEVVRYVQLHQDEWRWEEVPEFTVDTFEPGSPVTNSRIKVEGASIHVMDAGDHQVDIYDVSGRGVYRSKGRGQASYKLDLEKGLYFIKAQIGGINYTRKMVHF